MQTKQDFNNHVGTPLLLFAGRFTDIVPDKLQAAFSVPFPHMDLQWYSLKNLPHCLQVEKGILIFMPNTSLKTLQNTLNTASTLSLQVCMFLSMHKQRLESKPAKRLCHGFKVVVRGQRNAL
jgi:hypothetical protein